MDTQTAWRIFLDGFTDTAFARRVATRFCAGPLPAVRFAHGAASARTEFDEYFAAAVAPHDAVDAVQAARPLARHYLTVLEDRAGLEQEYALLGYTLSHRETLMACDLPALVPLTPPAMVSLLSAGADPTWYNASDPEGINWVDPDNLADSRMAHYTIVQHGTLVARGRNLHLDAAYSYVSRVFVATAQRGNGLAHALMARLLADDCARGAVWSVLTATAMGHRLYDRLGYRDYGTILIFTPHANGM